MVREDLRCADQKHTGWIRPCASRLVEPFVDDLANVGDRTAELTAHIDEARGHDDLRDVDSVGFFDRLLLRSVRREGSLVPLTEMHGFLWRQSDSRSDGRPERGDDDVEGIGVDLTEIVDVTPLGGR